MDPSVEISGSNGNGLTSGSKLPILLSCVVWGLTRSKKYVQLYCDNLSLVDSLNKGSSKDPSVMKLLRTLWLFIAYFDISIKATHIPGTQNNSADHLSRNSMEKFRQLRPNMPLRITSPNTSTSLRNDLPQGPRLDITKDECSLPACPQGTFSPTS